MFVLAGFGSFYIITGENILTGQKRDSSKVLPAKDVDLTQLNLEATEKEKEESLSPELLLFNEAMAKTTDKSGVRLNAVQKSEAAVFYRFGYDSKSNTYYVAAFASGLDPKKNYIVWLRNDIGEPFKLGVLKELDKSGVLKLGYKTDDSSITSYDFAAITIEGSENVENKDELTPSFDEKSIVFKSSFNPKEVWGEKALVNITKENTDSSKSSSLNSEKSKETKNTN